MPDGAPRVMTESRNSWRTLEIRKEATSACSNAKGYAWSAAALGTLWGHGSTLHGGADHRDLLRTQSNPSRETTGNGATA